VSLTVRLFASLRARYGDTLTLPLKPPIRTSELEGILKQQGVWTEGARIAVNQKFASPDDTIHETDEVAIIPPVSGG
jgi:molybdopterin converting factor small subunit